MVTGIQKIESRLFKLRFGKDLKLNWRVVSVG